MNSNKPKRRLSGSLDSPIADTNSGDMARKATASGKREKSRIRELTVWHVKGEILGMHVERRISARDYDAAISEAHAVGILVRECTPIQPTKQ